MERTEFQIDTAVKSLLGKIVDGTGTTQDKAEFQQLTMQRARMMRRGLSLTKRV